MGYTHFRSDVVGKVGTEKVASFVLKPKELNLTQSTNSYITLGPDHFIFWGALGNREMIATTVKPRLSSTAASGCGWIYLSNNSASGGLYYRANGTNASIFKANVKGGI
jgi:hypothetical protein